MTWSKVFAGAFIKYLLSINCQYLRIFIQLFVDNFFLLYVHLLSTYRWLKYWIFMQVNSYRNSYIVKLHLSRLPNTSNLIILLNIGVHVYVWLPIVKLSWWCEKSVSCRFSMHMHTAWRETVRCIWKSL